MVDDSMEIASEHGQNIVEEDIDIDIDLTTGHIDEDDILDDVDADGDFDTNITDVPAHIEADDLMIDDDLDDASYHMEDADLLEEEADDHNMEQEPPGLSFATDDPSNNSFNEIHVTESSILNTGVSDQFWDDSQVAQESNESVNAQDTEAIVHNPENVVDNSAVSANDLNAKDAQDLPPVSFSPPDEEVQSYSPQDLNYDDSTREFQGDNLEEPTNPVEAIDPDIYAEDEEHIDLSTTSVESGLIDPNTHSDDQGQAHPDPNITSTEKSSIDLSKSASESLEDSKNQHHAREIVVKYNNRNYPLIRKSSTDHPNEFFFEDPSVVEKSLNDFCSEIRKILMEENLPKDDKISLVIEELQLVIEESQLANYPDDLSLGQIIRLYERLVNNDGTGEIPPLNLRLVIQPTGHDRFLALLKGAAEGKGLLDFVTWDADSEDDPTEFGEPTENYDSESPPDEYNTAPEEADRAVEAIDVHDEKSAPATKNELPHFEHVDAATSASAETPQGGQGEVQREDGHPQSTPAEAPKSPPTLQQTDSEIDEDGDFIDYEDEENVEKPLNSGPLNSDLFETDESRLYNGRSTDFNLPCILPATCLCSTCNELVLTECRAVEEESRRNSISLRAEDAADELDNHVEGAAHTDETAQPEETFQDVESDIDYEEEDGDKNLKTEEAKEEAEATPNDIEHAETATDLGGPNDQERGYAPFDDNNEIEENGDSEGLDIADNILEPPPNNNNKAEQNGGSEVLDPADQNLEMNNVDISYDGNFENGEEQNFEEDEFDFGVDDGEEAEFLQNYQLDDDTTFADNNEFLSMSVGEDITAGNIAFDDTAAESDSATLSNDSIAAPQGTKPDVANGQDQEDEINYDDDEDDPPSPVIAHQPPTPNSKESPISISGKRPRAETDFEDGEDSITSEAKRIRS